MQQFDIMPTPPVVEDQRPLTTLTAREREVAALVAEGLSNAEIAQQLVLTEGTVANYVASSLRALGLKNRVQLAVWAVERGLHSSLPSASPAVRLRRGGRADDVCGDDN